MSGSCFVCGNEATCSELVCVACVRHREQGGSITLSKARVKDPNAEPANDLVNHPAHYTSHPSGVECIQIAEHMSFNVGNAIKYLWRADDKGDPIENLKKAHWYVEREIKRRTHRVVGFIAAK